MLSDVLPSLAILAAFSAVALVIIVSPGPDMAYFLGKTLSHGRAGGVAAFLGTSSGLLAHTLLAGFGLSALLAASVAAFTILKFAGAFYLLLLAVQALRKGSSFALVANSANRQGLRDVYVGGAAINLLNPKIVLFFVTFLPQFVQAGDPAAGGKLLFLGFYFIALSVPICLLLIVLAEQVSITLRQSPRLLRALDYVIAGIFGAFALRLLASRA